MREFTVELAARTAEPLTEDLLERFAELGGVAVGRVGDRRVEVTMTVEERTFGDAMYAALERVAKIAPSEPLAVEVMTTEEADRRSEELARIAPAARASTSWRRPRGFQ